LRAARSSICAICRPIERSSLRGEEEVRRRGLLGPVYFRREVSIGFVRFGGGELRCWAGHDFGFDFARRFLLREREREKGTRELREEEM
jgi:hypothetical protein